MTTAELLALEGTGWHGDLAEMRGHGKPDVEPAEDGED
jgi:hypothetical protein